MPFDYSPSREPRNACWSFEKTSRSPNARLQQARFRHYVGSTLNAYAMRSGGHLSTMFTLHIIWPGRAEACAQDSARRDDGYEPGIWEVPAMCPKRPSLRPSGHSLPYLVFRFIIHCTCLWNMGNSWLGGRGRALSLPTLDTDMPPIAILANRHVQYTSRELNFLIILNCNNHTL